MGHWGLEGDTANPWGCWQRPPLSWLEGEGLREADGMPETKLPEASCVALRAFLNHCHFCNETKVKWSA